MADINPTAFSDSSFFIGMLAGLLFLLASISFELGKKSLSLAALLTATLTMGVFIAGLDPFLVLWDEQYHALVAKNLMDNPFKPLLYKEPLLPFNYTHWTENYIWLHKPPLFLWQIALSLKLFGLSAFSVRVPDVIMHALAACMVYRIGSMMRNERAGFYGALFFALSYHLLELVAGKFATDHNDTAFLFYVTASLWSWFEFQHSGRKKWILWIGVFSGAAVLVKWLVGLLVFSIWGLTILFKVSNRNSWKPLLQSLAFSVLVFLPWYIFIRIAYPLEATYEMALNTAHFFKPIENHGGDLWFHFRAIRDLYGAGQAVPFILLLGLIILGRSISLAHRFAMVSTLVVVYVFYTAAATKMTSFGIIASPFVFLGLGTLGDSVITFVKSKTKHHRLGHVITVIIISMAGYFMLNVPRIERYHTNKRPDDNANRQADMAQMKLITALSTISFDSPPVLFNVAERMNGHIAVMFFTDFMAYDFIPSQEQIVSLKNKGRKIIVLDKGDIPKYLAEDSDVVILKTTN